MHVDYIASPLESGYYDRADNSDRPSPILGDQEIRTLWIEILSKLFKIDMY